MHVGRLPTERPESAQAAHQAAQQRRVHRRAAVRRAGADHQLVELPFGLSYVGATHRRERVGDEFVCVRHRHLPLSLLP
ncbi:hypothetical protein [Micromonospora tarensis]|uniref:hypothetical protein n=1 Tax=Micromonospora tarensis TaxID=2806100 RepID=UPI001EE42A76|nr:hypothetical protein [Micromonospora tarensis]